MTEVRTVPPIQAAAQLRADEIHVWQLAYRASDRRGPLHSLLAAYLGVAPDRVELVENEHGRPHFAAAHGTPLDFNWSHSGERALVAIGRGAALGIDLELRRERARALEIAERYFSPDEAAALRRLPVTERSVAFLELWTAKEAVLKALGRGIAFGLHRLSINIGHDQLVMQQFEGEDIATWQLRRLHLDSTQIAALAWRGDLRQVRLFALAGPD